MQKGIVFAKERKEIDEKKIISKGLKEKKREIERDRESELRF